MSCEYLIRDFETCICIINADEIVGMVKTWMLGITSIDILATVSLDNLYFAMYVFLFSWQ